MANLPIRTPRYVAVVAALAEDIEKGRYEIGCLLPTEAEFRQQFGVSRHTMREALRELKERGLISSRSGIGSHVRAKPSQRRFVHGVSTIEQLLQTVGLTRQEVVDKRELVADEEWAAILGCSPGRRWMEVRTLRWAPGSTAPIALVSAFIPPGYADIIELIGQSTQPIFSLIEQRHGTRVVEIRQEIVSVTLDVEEARRLSAQVGDTALKIIRHHLDEHNQVTQAAIGIYPSDRSNYVTNFRVHRNDDALKNLSS